MLVFRVLSAAVGIPLVLLLTFTGGYPFLGMVLLLAGAGLWELGRLLRSAGTAPWGVLLYGGLAYPVAAFVAPPGGEDAYLFGVVVGLLLLGLLGLLLHFPQREPRHIALSFFGGSYVGLLLSFLVRIRRLEEGLLAVVLLFVLVWACDTGSYFAGRFWGRRPLWRAVSPGKTWEGAAGGLLSSLLAGCAFFLCVPRFHLGELLGAGLLVGVTTQLGDLVESALKRAAGAKDSGCLIPGHGGVLDRFDGFIFSLPPAYLYFKTLLLR